MAKRVRRGEKLAYFEAHVMEASSRCRIWPYLPFNNGYAYLWINGKDVGVHVLTTHRWYGPKPSPSLEAAHSCGNPMCWAGEHLRWATPASNRQDKYLHGTMPLGEGHHQSTLTETQVREIRQRKASGASTVGLSREFGVSTTTIKKITNRTAWSWLQ